MRTLAATIGGPGRRASVAVYREEFELVIRLLAVIALTAIPGAGTAAAAADNGYSKAQTALFGTPHLDNIERPVTLRYDFSHGGSADDAFEDEIRMTVTAISADGGKDLDFEYLTGERRQPFNGVQEFRGNPLVMLFLQDDVNRMSKIVGGGEPYLRNRIRYAFVDKAEVAPVSFEFEGKQVEGTRVTLTPFLGDDHRAELKEFEFKRYEFTLSPDVPGAVYRIRSVVPQAGGDKPLFEDMVTFRDTRS